MGCLILVIGLMLLGNPSTFGLGVLLIVIALLASD